MEDHEYIEMVKTPMMILQEERKRTQGLQMMWEGAEEGDVDRF